MRVDGKQSEEHDRQASQIYLPTAEEVQAITSQHHQEHQAAAQRKAAETGSIVLSVVGGGFLIHQAREPILSLGFAALVSYLLANSLIKRLKKYGAKITNGARLHASHRASTGRDGLCRFPRRPYAMGDSPTF